MKKGFVAGIEDDTRKNEDFRRVLYTGRYAQLVLMRLKPGEEIGEEVHEDVDQILTFVSGEGMAILDGEESRVTRDHLVHVPAGTRHNIVNTGSLDLRLYTVYAPPQHKDGTIHVTKAEADAEEMSWIQALS